MKPEDAFAAGSDWLVIGRSITNGNIKIAGVTTLTSLDDKDLKEIGYNKKLDELVKHQAKLAEKAKLDAIICSGHEIKIVKSVFNKEIISLSASLQNLSLSQLISSVNTQSSFKGSTISILDCLQIL